MREVSICTVKVARDFDITAEPLFDAWLEPERASKFLFATPTGVMKICEIDPVVGGRFCIIETRGTVDAEHRGSYRQIDRPHQLSFSLDSDPKTSTNIIISISKTNTGCRLRLKHEGVSKGYEDKVIEGWTNILQTLAQLLMDENQPKPQAIAIR